MTHCQRGPDIQNSDSSVKQAVSEEKSVQEAGQVDRPIKNIFSESQLLDPFMEASASFALFEYRDQNYKNSLTRARHALLSADARDIGPLLVLLAYGLSQTGNNQTASFLFRKLAFVFPSSGSFFNLKSIECAIVAKNRQPLELWHNLRKIPIETDRFLWMNCFFKLSLLNPDIFKSSYVVLDDLMSLTLSEQEHLGALALQLARLLSAKNISRNLEARDLLNNVLSLCYLTDIAKEAEEQLRVLYKKYPQLIVIEPHHGLIRMARAYRKVNHKEVLGFSEFLLEMDDLKNSQKCRVHDLRARTLRRIRKSAKARISLDFIIDQCSEETERSRALLSRSRLKIKDGDNTSVEDLELLISDYPDNRRADDAFELLVKLDLASGPDDDTFAYLETLASEYPHGDRSREAVWAYIQYWKNQGDSEAYLGNLRWAVENFPHDQSIYTRGRFHYFYAKARGDLNSNCLNRKLWLYSAFFRYPVSFYGYLSFLELFGDIKSLALPDLDAHTKPLSFELSFKNLADRAPALSPLLGAGLLEEAAWYLRPRMAESDEEVSYKEENERLIWLLAWLLNTSGYADLGHDLIRDRIGPLKGWPTLDTWSQWRVSYPTPFLDLVVYWSARMNIDPWLIMGVIREESAFKVGVVSYAGAVGLMQLLVKTAKDHIKNIKTEEPLVVTNRESLKNPNVNIPLGIDYFRTAANQFNYNPFYMVPSYNSGRGSVRSWIKKRGELSTADFVESIPYTQTRDYTKRVIESYFIYQILYQWSRGSGSIINKRAKEVLKQRESD